MKEITPEDRKALIDTIATSGWEVIQKIVDNAERGALERCGNVNADHRYYQGMLFGIRNLYANILTEAKDPKAAPTRFASSTDYS
jgi:hypothetical protein